MQRSEDVLRAVLGKVRRRWFLAEWAVVAVWASVAVCLASLAFVALSWWGRPDLRVRVAVAGGLISAAVALLVWKIGPVRRRPSERQVARFVEERIPALQESLTSAVAAEHDNSRGLFHALVVEDAARRAGELDLDAVVPRRMLGRRAAAVAVLAACAALALWPALREGARMALEVRARWFPATLSLQVQPGDAEVVEGESFTVRAHVPGVPMDVLVADASVDVSGEPTRVLSMEADATSLLAEVPPVTSDLTYRVRVGALQSADYRVQVRRRPAVARIDVRYEYPRFTGLRPRVEEDAGDIYAPAGTKVEVIVTTREPVAAGELEFVDGAALPMAGTDPRQLRAAFTVRSDTAYRVSLDAGRGLRSRGDTEYFVRVMDDRPPEVRLVRPGTDTKVTRLEEVVIEARADDDHGVSRLELVYAAKGGAEQVVPLHAGRPAQTVTGAHVLPIEGLDVEPGDFVTVYARARDVGRGKIPSEVRSDIVFLEVRPFVEEFELATSQAMSGMAGGGTMDDLVGLQKQVVVATWRLERRSGAGRSAEDIRAVARAQAEVKSRAEQASRRMAPQQAPRRTRPGQPGPAQQPVPQPPPGPQAPTPMQQAIAAMGRAQVELEALRTAPAIPHEMAALNALLRAQADVQRRQVSQQRSASGRGGASGNQDLSALFDRELQRQQQTSYETPATAERREEARESDAMARLRELARRQEELARQQRELARLQARQTPDEQKRQLERLTREQEELQRQAEALDREMQRQQGGRTQSRGSRGEPGPGEQRGSGQGDEREGLRRALEEMRQASGELRRENAGEAGARAARAAEALDQARRGLQASAGAARDRTRAGADERERRTDQLARTQALRDRITDLSRRLDALRNETGAGQPRGEAAGASGRQRSTEQASRGESASGGSPRQSETRPQGQQAGGREGPSRQGGGQGQGGERAGELERVQGELQRALAQSRELLEEMGRENAGMGERPTTPRGPAQSPSAPGTEAFKQDFAKWEALKRDIELGLERSELSLSQKLAQDSARNRLDRGGDDRVPDAWKARVADYFRSLAKKER